MRKRFDLVKLLVLTAIPVLVLVMIYSGLRIWESTVFYGTTEETPTVSKTLTRDGVDYFPRQDITVILLMGIDQDGPAADSGVYTNQGTSDTNLLLVLDDTNETYSILALNRDTMMDIPILGIGGRPAGYIHGQLALAHTYGSGLQDSCENTRQAVSDFLYGLNIDYYMSMRMDAVGIFNDAVGGVKVHVTDDFSQVDSSIPMGEVVLKGQQALTFLRSRQGVGDQLNLSRMERQKAYMDGFVEAFRQTVDSSPQFFLTTYNSAAPYIVTDCSDTVLTNIADKVCSYTLEQIVTPEGENVKNEFMEFHADEQALDRLILQLFYAPKP